MKKIRNGFLVLASIMLVACNETQPTDDGLNKKNEMVPQGISVVNGILCFDTEQNCNYALNFLEMEQSYRENNFLSKCGNLTVEGYEEAEALTGYSENEVYEEFEHTYGFNSLRKKIHEEETMWLETLGAEEPDPAEDPDNHFVFDIGMRTILNEYCEIKIGDHFYKFFKGGYIDILDGDYEKLLVLRNNIDAAMDMDNINIVGNSIEESYGRSLPPCNGSEYDVFYKSGSGFRIKCKVGIGYRLFHRYTYAKTINYKRTGNNVDKWKRVRGNTTCRVWGDVSAIERVNDTTYVAECDLPETFNTETGYFSDSYGKKEWEHKFGVTTRTKTGWVKGYHQTFFNTNTGTVDLINTTILEWVSL
jgi:hypothetical protein